MASYFSSQPQPRYESPSPPRSRQPRPPYNTSKSRSRSRSLTPSPSPSPTRRRRGMLKHRDTFAKITIFVGLLQVVSGVMRLWMHKQGQKQEDREREERRLRRRRHEESRRRRESERQARDEAHERLSSWRENVHRPRLEYGFPVQPGPEVNDQVLDEHAGYVDRYRSNSVDAGSEGTGGSTSLRRSRRDDGDDYRNKSSRRRRL